jgi:hypothetical protein
MIYLLSSYNGTDRENLAIEMHKMFQQEHIKSQVVFLSFLLPTDAKYQYQKVTTEKIKNAFDDLQNRSHFPTRVFGLPCLRIPKQYRLLRNVRHIFFYIDESDNIRYKVHFFDLAHSRIKMVEVFDEQGQLLKTYEYNDRGFLSSIKETYPENIEIRQLLDNNGAGVLSVNYKNMMVETLNFPNEEKINERAFKGQYLKQLIQDAPENARFIITSDYDINLPLMNEDVDADKLFLLVDQPLFGGKHVGLGEEVFTNSKVRKVILKTKVELEEFQKKFKEKTPLEFVWNNYLPATPMEQKETEKQIIYFDIGQKEPEIDWEEFVEQLKNLADETNHFVIETQTGKAAIEIRQMLETKGIMEHCTIHPLPSTIIAKKAIQEAAIFVSLNHKPVIQFRIMDAIALEIPIIGLKNSINQEVYINEQNGALIELSQLEDTLKNLVISNEGLKAMAKKFNKENTMNRWKEILAFENC